MGGLFEAQEFHYREEAEFVVLVEEVGDAEWKWGHACLGEPGAPPSSQMAVLFVSRDGS